jgi:hypothetical protein
MNATPPAVLGRRQMALGAAATTAAISLGNSAHAQSMSDYFGINTLWPPGDEASLLDRFSRAKSLGFTNVRTDWEWRLGEPRPGQYDWEAFDRLTQAADRSGVKLLPIVHYAPDWALPPIAKPANISELGPDSKVFEAFGRFLAACVSRYGPGGSGPAPMTAIEDWQIWNEPNNKDFWGPAPEPTRFATMMRHVSKALQPYRGRIKVVHAGLSEPDVVFLWQLWEADSNYGDTFDVMAVHPYIFDWRKGVRRPEDIDSDVAADAALGFIGDKYKPNYLSKVFNLQLFMTLRGSPGKPIWITEMGYFVSSKWLGVTEDQQASLLEATMDFITKKLSDQPFGEGKRALATKVERVYWFALDDYPMPDGSGNFGLYRADRTPRPSAGVMRRLVRAVK